MSEPDLSTFWAQASDDIVKRELELTCETCGERLCDIEDGDAISVLVSMCEDHECDDADVKRKRRSEP